MRRCVALACAVLAGPACAAAGAESGGPGEPRPSFEVLPQGSLDPGFSWRTSDYVVRCGAESMDLDVRLVRGWQAKVDDSAFRGESITRPLGLSAGEDTTVTFRRKGDDRSKRFFVRCLPDDFPGYSFVRKRPGGPDLFTMQMGDRYLAIFNGDGVPVYWYKASGEPDNAQILPDGTLAFDPVNEISAQTGDYEIRKLNGRLIRVVRGAGGAAADIHEIQLLPNGNYLIGAQVEEEGVDTSAYGGSEDSTVINIEIQELTPKGRLVWSWNSGDHTKLAETGRWWDNQILDKEPYDISHWNSADVRGKSMLLSFRHLDAVYKINRKTGSVKWKLGGTPTKKSLEVRGDPLGDYPLGGQHDARFAPNGTVTIYDNRTGLADPVPRAVRYKINAKKRTARLVDSLEDPKEIPSSFCCGSSRLLDEDEWFVGWGGNGLVGAYEVGGARIFKLRLDIGFSYRALPVPPDTVDAKDLRRAMDTLFTR